MTSRNVVFRMGKDEAALVTGSGKPEGDLMSTVIDFLSKRLDDEQLKDLGNVLNTYSSTNSNDDVVGGGQAQAALEQLMKARDDMASTGLPVDPTAMDARTIYRGALKQMGLAMDGLSSDLPAPAYRAIFKSQVNHRRKTGQPLLRATPEATRSFESRFPHAGKIRTGRHFN